MPNPKCKACGAPLVWIKSAISEKMIPCNEKIIHIITDKGYAIHGRETHFSSCPQADKFRKKGTAKKPD